MSNLKGKVWHVKHPTFRYEEDVKSEARKAGLTVVDSKYDIPKEYLCKSPPKLTLKAKYKPTKQEK